VEKIPDVEALMRFLLSDLPDNEKGKIDFSKLDDADLILLGITSGIVGNSRLYERVRDETRSNVIKAHKKNIDKAG
jgi:hypothetical protein